MFIRAEFLMRLTGYKGMTIYPFVFYRGNLSERFIRHEQIHLKQQIELLIIPFFILYFLFYVINRMKGMDHKSAYRSNPFEVEAYNNDDSDYKRKFLGWIKYK